MSKLENDFIDKMKEHKAIIVKVAGLYASSNSDKEDIEQEILMQLWKSYNSFSGNSKFSTWMYRVAINTAVTFFTKKQKNLGLIEYKDYMPDFSGNEDIELGTDVKHLYEAIRKLDKLDRAIIILYLDEISHREIASIIGISEKTLNVRIFRIKGKLKRMLNQ